MKKLPAASLILMACLITACDQDCPMTGSPNTTYIYSFTDSGGTINAGSFTTDAGGNATISDVPDDIDCKKIAFREDKPSDEQFRIEL